MSKLTLEELELQAQTFSAFLKENGFISAIVVAPATTDDDSGNVNVLNHVNVETKNLAAVVALVETLGQQRSMIQKAVVEQSLESGKGTELLDTLLASKRAGDSPEVRGGLEGLRGLLGILESLKGSDQCKH